MVTNDPLCESDLTVTEVVYHQLCSRSNGELTKPFTLEHLDIFRCHFWVFGNEGGVDSMELL
jgi:hypothetical protein